MRGFFICFLLIAILLPVNGYSLGQFVNKDLVITKDYRFSKPDINQIKNTEFDRINLEKLPVESIPDLPVLPVKPLKILIPFGYEVINFEVENSKRKKVNGFYKIEFGDDIIPYSFKREELKNHRNFFKIDKKSPAIYKSQKPYPGRNYSSFNVQNLRGYQILCVKIHPLSYIPASGEITYASELKLRITCRKNNKRNDMLRNVRTDIELVKKFVDDPETLATYPDIKKNEGNAKYLIITNKALKAIEGQYTFNTLAEFLKTQGLTVKIVDVESIVEQTSGIDKQMKIRNYIKSAYKNWGTEFVLLGGDSDKNGEGNVIPIRSLYAIFTWEGRTFEEDLPADVYYSCLNGTFNFDKDNHYGEIGDGENGGEVDLLAEVFVGRAPVSNAEQLSNFVRKTIAAYSYSDRRTLFVGENLFPGIWGEFYMNEIRDGAQTHGYKTLGYNDSWEKLTLYDHDDIWYDTKLIDKINEGITIVNHIGHCSSTYAMKLIRYDLPRFKNTKYCLIYSQGCHAGQFTKRDCLMEMLMNTKHGAFAVIANSSYGLGPEDPDPDSSVVTRGASQYFHRQFTDAIFNEGINRLGQANQDSKEDNIHWMNHGTTRWVFWELNLMGDPYLPIN